MLHRAVSSREDGNFLPEDQPPGHRSTHGPLGTNEATYSDGDTCNRHKVKLYYCEEVVQRST